MAVAGMALHELTTNAAKHGSLSEQGGRVEVAWTLEGGDEPHLRIIWQERDGPPVTELDRSGFGTKLLQRVLGVQLSGTVEVSFARTGVRVTAEAKLPKEEEIGSNTNRLIDRSRADYERGGHLQHFQHPAPPDLPPNDPKSATT